MKQKKIKFNFLHACIFFSVGVIEDKMSKTFTINSIPYLDEYNKCYKNIMTINEMPQGPLAKYVTRLKLPKLSPFQVEGPCSPIDKCALAITNISNMCGGCGSLMTPNEIPDLISFLLSNGYQIENQLTNMMNQSIVKQTDKRLTFMVTYYGQNQPNIVYMR